MSSNSPVRFRARLGRVGVQQYSDGPQHRSPDEVFAPASLAGLSGLRVQRSHAPGMPAVGRVVPGSVRRDGDHIVAELEINDAATVADIRAGRLREISLAYSCEMQSDATGRKWQTQIRYDGPGAHVALLDSRTERARCGASCAIHDRQDRQDPMTQRTSDGGAFVADSADCTCDSADARERDKINGWLDGASARYGVSPAAIVEGMRARYGGHRHITRDMIEATARAAANGTGSYGRADGLADDNAFRASLARQLHADATPSVTAAVEAAIAGRPALARLTGDDRAHVVGTLEQAYEQGGNAQLARIANELAAAREHVAGVNAGLRGDAALADDDDAFRAHLARQL